MENNKNIKVENKRKTIEEIRKEKRILMILKEVNEELFGERGYSPIQPTRHSAR